LGCKQISLTYSEQHFFNQSISRSQLSEYRPSGYHFSEVKGHFKSSLPGFNLSD
jgi:hypothetical protein